MSHFFTVVLIEPDVTNVESKVKKLLAPYNEELQVKPYKVYEDVEEIKRMAKNYKLPPTDLKGLAKKMGDWAGASGGVDKKGLYHVSTYNPKSQWDYWRFGGRWCGEVRGLPKSDEKGYNFGEEFGFLDDNICAVREIPKDFICFAIVTPDGKWHERGGMGWWGMVSNEKEEKEWKKELEALLIKHHNCIAVGCDLHI